MRVIIPAAGLGSRLAPFTNDRPKGAVQIAGEPLLWHTLAELCDAGTTRVIVVCGYHGEQLRAVLARSPRRPPLEFVTNPAYATTNSMVSLWLTRRWWDQPFCVVDGDLLVSSELLRRVFDLNGDRLVVDRTRRSANIEVNVEVSDGLVTRIGSRAAASRSSGEFFGVSRWTPEGAGQMAEAISRRLSRDGQRQWYAQAIRDVVVRTPVRTVQASGGDWAEVDCPRDIPPAERLVRQWRLKRSGRQGCAWID